MAEWSTAFINDLPDSSFLWIQPGGKKDADGKTTPRSLRHLPYKDASGKIDTAHLDNAKSRIGQVEGMPADVRTRIEARITRLQGQHSAGTDADRDFLTAGIIRLDANGNIPTRLPLVSTFKHENSIKGANFEINVDDAREMIDHFDSCIGFPTEDATTGLAIDFKHEYDDEAGGWIKGLELSIDPHNPDHATIYANPVEWSDSGEAAIRGGRFKMISPSGALGRKNGRVTLWSNPNNVKEKYSNVIDGAGLTNIPYQRAMSPIRADRRPDGEYDKVIVVDDVQQTTEEQGMNLDAVRIKERDDLSVKELDFLAENRESLKPEELTKFKLEAPAATDTHDELSTEDKETLAAIKSGSKKVVSAAEQTAEKERLDRLDATVAKYEAKEVSDLLDAHIKRGALKQDQKEFWSKQLLSATDDTQRKAFESALDALESNDKLAVELGTGEDVQAGSTAREQLDALAKKKVEAAAKKGDALTYADALKQVYRENNDLRTQDSQESKSKASVR